MTSDPPDWTPRHEAEHHLRIRERIAGRPLSGDDIRALMEWHRATAAELARMAHAADERAKRGGPT